MGVSPAWADTIRIATYAAPLSRNGPGLLLADILNKTPEIWQVSKRIETLTADVLLLTDIDYDRDLHALNALNDRLTAPYPHVFALRPNSGMQTGFDVDQNGRLGEARDAIGYGRFNGDGGMAILSHFPIGTVTDYSDVLWADLPQSLMAKDDPLQNIQRLSTVGHWQVEISTPNHPLTLLAFSATPPVFDGPEDRNGRRNADEIQFWQRVLNGDFGPPPNDFVILGIANLDPDRGEGRREAIIDLLNDPRIHEPLPNQPTAHWPEPIGELRVDIVLPSTTLTIQNAGIEDTPIGPHRPVWVDVLSAP
ncbi:hypothetical protein A9199_13210 [Donghicola sp. JL3646]|nr:hypothetical protein A9199_13210 [Donghicola sp. JL3646]